MYFFCLVASPLLFGYACWRWSKMTSIRQYGTVGNPNPDPHTLKGIESFFPRPEDFRGKLTQDGKTSVFAYMMIIGVISLCCIIASLYVRYELVDVKNNITVSWFAPIFFYAITALPVIAEIVVRRQVKRLAQP